jgi:hypothetical protein
MAFNANSFINQSNVPPLYRLINGITTQSVSGFSQSATTIAQQTAETLTTSGSSLAAAQSTTASTLDGLLSYGSPDFFGGSGLAPSKAAAADIGRARVAGSATKTYFSTSNPNIKVDKAAIAGQALVVSVL